MSGGQDTAARHPMLQQERDRMPAWAVYGFSAGLAILLGCGGVVAWISNAGGPVQTGWRREAAPVQEVPREIQGVDQSLFAAHEPSVAPDWAARRRALAQWQWADRDRRVVRMPIDRAMDLVAKDGHVE